ncbi:hypothetical protein EDB85DRAFT_1887614 [Lactarius pseudohatsudake]|nr:hypothetical protein EDB85DRAFT_1887614 [Lactarius pseudohatsudake]
MAEGFIWDLLLLLLTWNIVNGTHKVAHHNLTNLSHVGLQELCNAFCLTKTGNKMTLTDWLKNFSADQQGWDSLLAGAHKKHCGPQDGGVTKSMKGLGKKASTKWSMLRCKLLFSAATCYVSVCYRDTSLRVTGSGLSFKGSSEEELQ